MAFEKFNIFTSDRLLAVHDFSAHTLKAFLATTVADPAADAVRADLTEIANGNGYTTGGVALTNLSYVNTGGTILFTCDPITFTASGGTMASFRSMCIYNDTTSAKTDPLIFCENFDVGISLASGEFITRTPNASTGIFQMS